MTRHFGLWAVSYLRRWVLMDVPVRASCRERRRNLKSAAHMVPHPPSVWERGTHERSAQSQGTRRHVGCCAPQNQCLAKIKVYKSGLANEADDVLGCLHGLGRD